MNYYVLLLNKLFLLLFLNISIIMGSGGFDHGTTVGKNKLQMDFTLNPFDVIDFGQTYVVVSFGLEEKFDFHGYVSHEANGTNQFYYGCMYQFMEKEYLNLSTAIGFRCVGYRRDIFFHSFYIPLK